MTSLLEVFWGAIIFQTLLEAILTWRTPYLFGSSQPSRKTQKHNIDHALPKRQKKPSARTHTWKDLCFKGKWEEYSSHKTLQLLGLSQNPTAFEVVQTFAKPKNTTSTTAKAAKKNHNPEPIPGRIPASREIGGQTSVTGPYSFWGRPNLRKTQKTQHRPLPKRQKKTTTLNPYLAGFLLQEKLGGKLQLQDPTAFEVVQTFAKPKKHKVDHCQSGKKEPQPWTHTWKDSCFKRNWGANFSYRTLQLLRLSKPSQNPKNITWTTAEEAKKNHNPEPILGRIPASSLVRGASSTWLPKSLAFEVIQAFLQKKEKHDRLKRSQKKHQKEPFSSHQFEVIFRRPFPYPALPPRTRSTGAGTLPKGMKNYSEVRIL